MTIHNQHKVGCQKCPTGKHKIELCGTNCTCQKTEGTFITELVEEKLPELCGLNHANQEKNVPCSKCGLTFTCLVEEKDLCNHCLTPINVRNKSGKCDHLYYPENCDVCSSQNDKQPEPQAKKKESDKLSGSDSLVVEKIMDEYVEFYCYLDRFVGGIVGRQGKWLVKVLEKLEQQAYKKGYKDSEEIKYETHVQKCNDAAMETIKKWELKGRAEAIREVLACRPEELHFQNESLYLWEERIRKIN